MWRVRLGNECARHGRFFAVFVVLWAISLVWLQLSCQHLHHCGVHVFTSPWPPYESERLERSLAFLEQERWREGPRPAHLVLDRGFSVKLCLAMVTVERRQRYMLQAVASFLFHARDDLMSNQSLFFLVAGEAAQEPHADAEHLHATVGVPLLRVPTSGFCTAHRAGVNFYGRKAEVFAFAMENCRSRLAEDGWMILLEDDVVSSPNILSLSWNLLKGNGASMVKLFEPDEFNGWGMENVSLLMESSLLVSLIICALARKRSLLVLAVCFMLNVVWLRALPLQVWAMLFRGSSIPVVRPGVVYHATQAVAVPIARNMSLTLQDTLCNHARLPDGQLNQDLIVMHWARVTGGAHHAAPSLFQHIGAMTSVKGPHQGWKLVDLTFGEEQMPLESWRSRIN